MNSPFSVELSPDWEGFLRCLRREGIPDRVYFIELLIDEEIKSAVTQRFGLLEEVQPDDPFYRLKREVRVRSASSSAYSSASMGMSTGFPVKLESIIALPRWIWWMPSTAGAIKTSP